MATAISLCTGPARAQKAEDAFGLWRHPENGSLVRMYRCHGDRLCAKIAKIKDKQKFDTKNPDARKRRRPIVGLVIMSGARKTGANTWDGQLYNRADGGVYDGKLTVKSRNRLELAGCSKLLGFICKTVAWSRVK